MVVLVHSEKEGAVGFAAVGLEAEDVGRELFPLRSVGYAQAHVSKLGDACHAMTSGLHMRKVRLLMTSSSLISRTFLRAILKLSPSGRSVWVARPAKVSIRRRRSAVTLKVE